MANPAEIIPVEQRDVRPGETDEHGTCLMGCGRYGLREFWCRHCAFEWLGDPEG